MVLTGRVVLTGLVVLTGRVVVAGLVVETGRVVAGIVDAAAVSVGLAVAVWEVAESVAPSVTEAVLPFSAEASVICATLVV